MFNFGKPNLENNNNRVKSILKIKGMHCTSCAMMIDNELEQIDGIKSSMTNYASSKTIVEHEPEKITIQEIQVILRKIGYKSDID